MGAAALLKRRKRTVQGDGVVDRQVRLAVFVRLISAGLPQDIGRKNSIDCRRQKGIGLAGNDHRIAGTRLVDALGRVRLDVNVETMVMVGDLLEGQ